MLAETKVPKITVIMMAISDFCVKNFLWILLAIAALVIIVVFVFRIPAVKVFKDRFLVKCPKLGPLMKIIVTADFARTIASLYSSGMTIVNAMQCSKETINNRYVRSQFASAVKSIRAGKSLSQAIRDVDGFDKKLADTIEIGEETGKLDDMLNMAADTYEYDSQAAIKRLTGILEPLMIVIMAGVVVVVMLSVLMPMFNMYGSIDENSEAIFSYLSQILF